MAGYNHKLRILLETVVKKIANFKVKPDRFLVIKVMINTSYATGKVTTYVFSFFWWSFSDTIFFPQVNHTNSISTVIDISFLHFCGDLLRFIVPVLHFYSDLLCFTVPEALLHFYSDFLLSSVYPF